MTDLNFKVLARMMLIHSTLSIYILQYTQPALMNKLRLTQFTTDRLYLSALVHSLGFIQGVMGQ